jgi:pyrophosphatase PpaX
MQFHYTIKGVLFDLDGTLINSREADSISFKQVLHDYLDLNVPEDTMFQYCGVPTTAILLNYAPQERIDELQKAWLAYKMRLPDRMTSFPGVRDMLSKLKSAGLKLGVVTSQLESECMLARSVLKVEDLIDVWINSNDVPVPKPDPAGITLALSKLSIAPENAVMIGDTVFDMGAGRKAGTHIGVVLWGNGKKDTLLTFQPEFVFEQMEEIGQLAEYIQLDPK